MIQEVTSRIKTTLDGAWQWLVGPVPGAGSGVMDAGKWRSAVRVAIVVSLATWIPVGETLYVSGMDFGPLVPAAVAFIVEALAQRTQSYRS